MHCLHIVQTYWHSKIGLWGPLQFTVFSMQYSKHSLPVISCQNLTLIYVFMLMFHIEGSSTRLTAEYTYRALTSVRAAQSLPFNYLTGCCNDSFHYLTGCCNGLFNYIIKNTASPSGSSIQRDAKISIRTYCNSERGKLELKWSGKRSWWDGKRGGHGNWIDRGCIP